MVNREALLNLARVVAVAPKERWDMHFFGTCDTARCAAGHAAEDPWFKEHAPIPTDKYGMLDWDRLHEPFGITSQQAFDLFAANINGKTVSRIAVLANIMRLLRGDPPKEY